MAGPRRPSETGTDLPKGSRILVVESRYYEEIATALFDGARAALEAAEASYDVITVPGALEIPQAIAIASKAHKKRNRYDGAIALGCVIRGETSHYDIVAGESARALMDLGVKKRFPVGNGILTVDTKEQALARALPEQGNKGGAAVEAALSLILLKRHGAGAAS